MGAPLLELNGKSDGSGSQIKENLTKGIEELFKFWMAYKSFQLFIMVLTQNCANTLECSRTRNDRQNDEYSENPGRTGLTGFADRSDRCEQGAREDLKQRAQEGPCWSS